jgi:energy-coupling factor transport system ATP-binding protein
VWHELAFGLESLGYSTSVIRRRVAEMANYFGIEDWFRKDTATLSGGQKQMLNLASVMVMQPKILLLDEPTAQLDPIAAANFISTLQKLNHGLGLTILLVEHRLEEVFPIADRVLMLTHGKLVYQDCPQNISFYFKQNFSEQNRLNQNPFKHMEAALPSAMRIYNALQNEDSLQSDTLQTDIECPLTVKEGRDYIIKNFDNQIDTVEEVQPQQKNKTVFELKQVWFRYEKEMPDILRGVNLSVYEGENLCILGGNGSGKTTTLGIAAGLLKAYQGTVLLH